LVASCISRSLPAWQKSLQLCQHVAYWKGPPLASWSRFEKCKFTSVISSLFNAGRLLKRYESTIRSNAIDSLCRMIKNACSNLDLRNAKDLILLFAIVSPSSSASSHFHGWKLLKSLTNKRPILSSFIRKFIVFISSYLLIIQYIKSISNEREISM
jgi:hypothetical protein